MSVLEKVKSYVGAYSDTDIRSILAADHDEIQDLANQMAAAESPRVRLAAFERLKPLLTTHARAEEITVYNKLIALRGSPDSHDLGNEGFVEHSLLDVLLERLGKTELVRSDAWRAHAKVLKELLNHHIKEEEGEMFEEIGEHFSDEERDAIGAEFNTRKQSLTTAAARRQTPRLLKKG
jgi:hypothetical protein